MRRLRVPMMPNVPAAIFSRLRPGNSPAMAFQARGLTRSRLARAPASAYYFGDKEGLYLRALEDAYCETRASEAKLDTKGLPPVEALRQLVEFTFDHHHRHEDFIRLVMIENIHRAKYLKRSEVIRKINASAIDHIAAIYKEGVAKGIFRPGIDPVELHWLVSALCFFNVSNRATFSLIFGRDFGSEELLNRLRQNVVDAVLRFVAKSEKDSE